MNGSFPMTLQKEVLKPNLMPLLWSAHTLVRSGNSCRKFSEILLKGVFYVAANLCANVAWLCCLNALCPHRDSFVTVAQTLPLPRRASLYRTSACLFVERPLIRTIRTLIMYRGTVGNGVPETKLRQNFCTYNKRVGNDRNVSWMWVRRPAVRTPYVL